MPKCCDVDQSFGRRVPESLVDPILHSGMGKTGTYEGHLRIAEEGG